MGIDPMEGRKDNCVVCCQDKLQGVYAGLLG